MQMTQAELDEVLRLHKLWRFDCSTGKRAELRGADLIECDLHGANLCNADLTGADLRNAQMDGALLRHADLHDANLSGANLTDAYMALSDLRGADLTHTRLSNAVLAKADLTGAGLRNAKLLSTRLDMAIGVVCAGYDPRGYRFVGVRHGECSMVAAGCRWFTVAEAREHWGAKYNADALARVALIETSLHSNRHIRGEYPV